jgi:hypothetical protein
MRVIYLVLITAVALLALLLAAVAALRAQGQQQVLQGMLNTVAVVYER